MKVSLDDLITRLANIRKACPITFEAETEPKLIGEVSDFVPPLKKKTIINGFVGFEYHQAILRRLAKEGKDESFKSGKSWHEPYSIEGSLTPLSIKKGELVPKYLRLMVIKRFMIEFFDKNNNKISEDIAKRYISDKPRYTNQCLKKPLEFLVYKLENLKWITVSGETYEIR